MGFGILLLGALMSLEYQGPRDQALDEAGPVVFWVFLAVAAAWFVSLSRVLPIGTRIRVLRWCLIAIGVTAVAWLGWMLLRGSSRFG